MPSSYSTSLRVELQFTGENINLWGDKLNSALQRLDSAIAGWTTIAITGDYTLTTANGSADEARSAMLKFNGTLAANSTIVCPAVSKTYFVFNNTNKALAFSIGAGTTVSIDAGDKTVVYCDGTGFHTITFGALGLKDYIASVTASAGAVPGVTGNAGKYLYTDGASAFWRQPSTADLSDYNTLILGVQVALAVAL
jgi:hypothetical protein